MPEVSLGILLAALAGIQDGSFASPTKYAQKWNWENIWAVWAVVAMLLLPWFLVFVTVPHVARLYANADADTLWLVIIFGVGFGLAQIFFGLGIAVVGISLNFAIALGLSTALGSLVPLVFLQPETIPTPKGETILLGVGLVLAGIVLCAVAGHEKEREFLSAPQDEPSDGEKRISYKTGLILCILAGLGSPLINFGLAFGTPLTQQAIEQGVSKTSQANVIWAPLVSASLIPFLIYCIYLWRKNRSFRRFALPGTGANWMFGALMGVLWFGAIALYGASASHLEAMGPVLGWPLFMSSVIITSNIWGVATGEWKGTSRKPRLIILCGIFMLILGFAALAVASILK